ncbi:MAG: hypothetical protein PHV82_16430 [Victivallaceae bacterium]|nr:hypothetical protein [Victivallaceae bacterium]
MPSVTAERIGGIKHIFSNNGGFQNELQIIDFEVILHSTLENLTTQLLPFFYYSHLLSANSKKSVKKEWLAIFDQEQRGVNGMLALGVPLSVFTVIKKITNN